MLLAGAFLLPPTAAALVALPGALLLPVEHRPRLARRLWRTGQLVVAVWAASLVHLKTGGRDAVAHCDMPGALATAGAAVLAFCLVLTLLDGGVPAPAPEDCRAAGPPPRPPGRGCSSAPSRRSPCTVSPD